jgi:HEAT repeat protein
MTAVDQLPPDINSLREAILSGDPSLAMPALVRLRDIPDEQAVPLLLLALKDSTFLVRSLGCAGLGVKRNEAGWEALVEALQRDGDANVRAEAANSLVNYGVKRAWPLLKASFAADDQWLVRCSILSALAEQAEMPPEWLLELAQMAIVDTDGTVRTGGAEILGRLLGDKIEAARPILVSLQADPDHRVTAAALNGLQM